MSESRLFNPMDMFWLKDGHCDPNGNSSLSAVICFSALHCLSNTRQMHVCSVINKAMRCIFMCSCWPLSCFSCSQSVVVDWPSQGLVQILQRGHTSARDKDKSQVKWPKFVIIFEIFNGLQMQLLRFAVQFSLKKL